MEWDGEGGATAFDAAWLADQADGVRSRRPELAPRLWLEGAKLRQARFRPRPASPGCATMGAAARVARAAARGREWPFMRAVPAMRTAILAMRCSSPGG